MNQDCSLGAVNPIPIPALPLKGRETCHSPPFKGGVGGGMGSSQPNEQSGLNVRCLIGLACCCVSGAVAADQQWSVSTGLDYSSGKYGSSTPTEIWYVPLSGRLETGAWEFKLTLPYVRMRSASGGVIVGYDANGLPIRSGAGAQTTVAGLGDVVASATYGVVTRPRWLLDVTAKVKWGTGSVDKGLGTGETDFAVGVDSYFPLGKATPFLSLGYRRPGDPSGQDLLNTRQAGVGLAYKLSDTWSLGAMYDWRSAASAGGTAARDLMAYAVYKFSPSWKLQGYASRGFTDASADYGLGLMLKHIY